MVTSVDESLYWDSLYNNGEANWDLKSPNPVFESILSSSDIIQPSSILIIGSGKGYDAAAAAKAGYKVTAVDFAEAAIEHSRELIKKENLEVRIIRSDIFKLRDIINEQFDVVYEYTTFCAINPSRRKELADEIISFLRPGGKFVSVVFPIDGREGGPPFNIDLVEFYKLFSAGLKLDYSSRRINSVKPRKGKEILQVYIKPEVQ